MAESWTATARDSILGAAYGRLRVRFNRNNPHFARLMAMPNALFSAGVSRRPGRPKS